MKVENKMELTDYLNKHYLLAPNIARASGDPFAAFMNGERVKDWLQVHLPVQSKGRILDVGCGDGRVAAAFARDENFDNEYVGFDINLERIRSIIETFKAVDNFTFFHSDIYHSYYNLNGKLSEKEFLYGDIGVRGCFDLIFYNSIFSHMATDAILHHLSQGANYLNKSGRIWATGYILDDNSPAGFSNSYWSFITDYDKGFTATPKNPEGCVAFHSSTWSQIIESAGLAVERVIRGYWYTQGRSLDQHRQDIYVLKKP